MVDNPSLYRPGQGSASGSFLRKEPSSEGKTRRSIPGKSMCVRGARGRLTILYALLQTTQAEWGPSAII
jgi:hypothetical protein